MIDFTKSMNIGLIKLKRDLPKTEMKAMIGWHLYRQIGCSNDIWAVKLKVILILYYYN